MMTHRYSMSNSLLHEVPFSPSSTRATSGKRHVLSDTTSDDAPKKKKRATKQESYAFYL